MFCCDVLLLAAYIVACIVLTAYNFVSASGRYCVVGRRRKGERKKN